MREPVDWEEGQDCPAGARSVRSLLMCPRSCGLSFICSLVLATSACPRGGGGGRRSGARGIGRTARRTGRRAERRGVPCVSVRDFSGSQPLAQFQVTDLSLSHFGAVGLFTARCESTPEQPLFYPCLCKGSIRYIHQDCLVEWLKHSNKTSCELCKVPFRFRPGKCTSNAALWHLVLFSAS